MSKKPQRVAIASSKVDVRGVEPDVQTDSLIEVWMARQKAKGNKMKKGEAVVELTKRGLIAEGIA